MDKRLYVCIKAVITPNLASRVSPFDCGGECRAQSSDVMHTRRFLTSADYVSEGEQHVMDFFFFFFAFLCRFSMNLKGFI